MNAAKMIKRLQSMPPEAEVLMGVEFALYHTTDHMYHHVADNKVVIDGDLWMGDKR